ncbi:MAG: flagellar filament capping protein FliD [Lachnospiraceae bacterium]|nr:flagellar filament capping protein FliD [Lachnospiraceae bacterium]
MANSIQSSQIYNHFLTAYAPKEVTRADTHKKDELRGIYNSIVRLSKESPLYLLTNDSAMEADAIGIKESARDLQGTLADLEADAADSIFSKKSAYTSDDTMLHASYIGGDRPLEDVPSFQIEVDKLATQQKNTGNYMEQAPTALQPGAYSFNIRVNDLNYEFQYSVKPADTNLDIQERLGRLINKSNIGLSAEVLADDAGRTALSITSDDYGIPEGRESRFSLSEPLGSDLLHGTVGYFGLDKTEIPAGNAEFVLNGNPHSSVSNHFTVASMYELHLLRASEWGEAPVSVGVKDDNASTVDRTKELVEGYNSFIDRIQSFQGKYFKGTKIMSEVTGIFRQFSADLEPLGMKLSANGHIDLDTEALDRSATDANVLQGFKPVREFTAALQEKMEQIALDPMHYIERPVVAYKNPGHGFPSPYITSEYSGMMFSGYC